MQYRTISKKTSIENPTASLRPYSTPSVPRTWNTTPIAQQMESVGDVYAFVATHKVLKEHAEAEVLCALFTLLASGKWGSQQRESILLSL